MGNKLTWQKLSPFHGHHPNLITWVKNATHQTSQVINKRVNKQALDVINRVFCRCVEDTNIPISSAAAGAATLHVADY